MKTLMVSPIAYRLARQYQSFLLKLAEHHVHELHIYCSSVLFRNENRSKVQETLELAAMGSMIIPIIVYREDDPEAFKWFLGEPRPVTHQWMGKPNEVVYKIPNIHGFLDNGILNGYHGLVRLENPILREIPVNVKEPLYSWYVGFVVNSNLF